MEWLRNNDPDPDEVDDPTVQALANLACVRPPVVPFRQNRSWSRSRKPLLLGQPIPEAKKAALDEAMEWVRNNDPNQRKVDDPTAQAVANLVEVPMPRGSMPVEEERAVLEDALEWARSDKPKPQEVDEHVYDLCQLPREPAGPW